MTIEVYAMSDEELKKLEVIKRVSEGLMTYRTGGPCCMNVANSPFRASCQPK